MDWMKVRIYGGIAASMFGIPYIYLYTDLGLAWALLLAMPSMTCFIIAAFLYKQERKGKIKIVYRRRLNGRN